MDYDDSYDWYDDRSRCENCNKPTWEPVVVQVLVEDRDAPWRDTITYEYWCFYCAY